MIESQPKQVFSERLKGVARAIKDRVTKEDRRPHLVLSDSAKKTIRNWVLKPNPRQSEVSFIGVGTNNIVDTVYAPDGDFSPRSGMFLERFSGAKTDMEESRLLWERVYRDGRFNEVSFFGHLHPSGSMTITQGETIVNVINMPREALLYPSKEDVAASQLFVKENPHINVPCEAIATNTQNGPCLRIYLVSELLKAKHGNNIWKVPYQTIQL